MLNICELSIMLHQIHKHFDFFHQLVHFFEVKILFFTYPFDKMHRISTILIKTYFEWLIGLENTQHWQYKSSSSIVCHFLLCGSSLWPYFCYLTYASIETRKLCVVYARVYFNRQDTETIWKIFCRPPDQTNVVKSERKSCCGLTI